MLYRIKQYIYSNRTEYVVQRKSIFGFWYNPDNIDAYTTGFYNSYEEAKEALDDKLKTNKGLNFIKQFFCKHDYRIIEDDKEERSKFFQNMKKCYRLFFRNMSQLNIG